ncbi:MAG: formylglycine-generating enzyme family protein [bacterium]
MKPSATITKWIMFCLPLTVLSTIVGCAGGMQAHRTIAKNWENPQPGKEVKIKIDDTISLEMVFVPSGTFQMGSPKTDRIRRDDEKLVHAVELDGFWMGKFEITQAQYEAITGKNPSKYKGKNLPVEKVTWNDAVEFCKLLSEKTELSFTLPTEAQWEYACRAGSTTVFAFGDCLEASDANFDGTYPLRTCPKGDYLMQTWDVGSGKPNAWGLYDMHGNVWEWCLDWYAKEYSTDASSRNPTGPIEGENRVFRGGCWNSDAGNCRSAARFSALPTASGEIVGFRVALNNPAIKPGSAD